MLGTLIIVAALPTRSPQHALSEPLQQFVTLLQHRLEAKRQAHLPPAPSISAPPSAAPTPTPTPTAAPLVAHLDRDTFCADVVPWAPPDLRGLAAYQHRAAHANLENHYRPLLAGVDAPTASVCAALMKEIVCGSYFPYEDCAMSHLPEAPRWVASSSVPVWRASSAAKPATAAARVEAGATLT